MTLRTIGPWLALGMVFGLLSPACGDPDDPDCFQLCRNYDDCVRAINVDTCVTSCEFEVGVFESEARSCQRCIEGLSCSDQASCWAPLGDCVDFVAFVSRNGRFEPEDANMTTPPEAEEESEENDD